MAETKFVQTSDGVKIFYYVSVVEEAKQTLVLLHGLGGEASAWGETVKHLNGAGYSTLAIDLRGHGASARVPKLADYSFKRLAEDVKEVFEKENLDKCVLVGHCYGGMVALVFAGLYAECLKGLILVDTTDKSPLVSMTGVNIDFLIKVLKSVLGQAPNTDWSVKRIIEDIRRTSIYNYVRSFKNSVWYGAADLNKITVPTLIVHGDEDAVIPTQTANMMHKNIVGSELEILKKANHIVVLNEPLELFRTIDGFVRSLLKT